MESGYPTILVIEDSAVIWRLIRASCQDLAEFDWEADGVSGLDAVKNSRPDLVILDIGLPLLDGWGVLAGMRADERTRNVPVLVLTAHADTASREKARTGGAQAFMTKPFRPNDLRSTIGLLLPKP
jgi:two-component system, chemotaxis family, chemotaxis protein CheY